MKIKKEIKILMYIKFRRLGQWLKIKRILLEIQTVKFNKPKIKILF
jgi:hypothetical protein